MMSSEEKSALVNEYTAMDSTDLALLEEICEEAMEMTIKEALLHSTDPDVRRDLLEGQFKLTPAEVQSLEIFCEAMIGNLVTESIEGSVSSLNSRKSKKLSKMSKSSMAEELSEVDLEILKRSCERILETIITESLQDSSRILSHEEADIKSTISLQNIQSEDIVSALIDFQSSKELQRYIGHLTADIVKTALSKVAVTNAICKEQENGKDVDNKFNKMHDTPDSHYNNKLTDCSPSTTEIKTVSSVIGEGSARQTSDQRFSSLNGTSNDRLQDKQTVHGCDYSNDSDIEGEIVDYGYQGGLMDVSLEYDAEWENHGGLSTDLQDSFGEAKQKILLQELSFDEKAEVKGSELMAPVFLAIAEEDLYDDDEEFQHMRLKAQSIEDLCHIIRDEEDVRPRSKSLQDLNRAKGHMSFWFPAEDSEHSKLADSLSDIHDESDNESEASDRENDGSDIDETGSMTDEPRPMSPAPGLKDYRWHTVTLAGREKVLDLKLLEPYMKVITHGGYYKKEEKSVIVVITACYLPDRSNSKYQFLMEQLFFYVMSTIELLATSTDYYVVYLNGGTTQKNTPSVNWMKKFYQYIDRHQRKNMLKMFVVHPTFWLKALMRLAKPFMSPQFWHKLNFVHSLRELAEHVPLEYMFLPDDVVRSDPLYRQQHGM